MIALPPHRAIALGLFRSSVCFFAATAAFAESDLRTRSILVTIIFVLDALSWHLCEVIMFSGNSVYNRVWHDTLSNRLAFEKLVERYRSQQQIDVGEVVKEGTASAREDIAVYLRDTVVWYDWGWFKKTLMGAGHFLWFWVSYGIFYGLAGVLGSMAH